MKFFRTSQKMRSGINPGVFLWCFLKTSDYHWFIKSVNIKSRKVIMANTNTSTDVILIGAGIMSATLGTILKQLEPSWNITLVETLETSGEESSNAWNNAGTGHSALCELNYTTENKDGSMDISKALNINEQFQVSKQFWSYLVENRLLENPKDF